MNQKRIKHAAVAARMGTQENIAPPKTARGDRSFPFRGAFRSRQSTAWKRAVEECCVLRMCHFAPRNRSPREQGVSAEN